MTSVKWYIFFFVISATIFSFSAGQELDNSEFIDEEIFQSSELKKAPGKPCDTSYCEEKDCNCCPGYGFFKGGTHSKDECVRCYCGDQFNCTFDERTLIKLCMCPKGYVFKTHCIKCDCGKDFDCELPGSMHDPKICICPKGYSQKSESCRADCKTNPCQNEGKCTVKNEDIVCECITPYTGEFCEKKVSIYPPTTTSKTTTAAISTTEETKTSTDAKSNIPEEIMTPTIQIYSMSTPLSSTKMSVDVGSTVKNVTENDKMTTIKFVTDNNTLSTTESVKITTKTISKEETIPTTTTSEPKRAEIGLIVLSIFVVPLALFSAFMVYKYKRLNKKLQKTQHFDDSSSIISMEPTRRGLTD